MKHVTTMKSVVLTIALFVGMIALSGCFKDKSDHDDHDGHDDHAKCSHSEKATKKCGGACGTGKCSGTCEKAKATKKCCGTCDKAKAAKKDDDHDDHEDGDHDEG